MSFWKARQLCAQNSWSQQLTLIETPSQSCVLRVTWTRLYTLNHSDDAQKIQRSWKHTGMHERFAWCHSHDVERHSFTWVVIHFLCKKSRPRHEGPSLTEICKLEGFRYRTPPFHLFTGRRTTKDAKLEFFTADTLSLNIKKVHGCVFAIPYLFPRKRGSLREFVDGRVYCFLGKRFWGARKTMCSHDGG